MTPDDRRRLVTAVTAIYAYYERQVSDLHLQFWLEDLGGFPIEAVERAMVAHRKDPERGQFLPKTADIIRQLQGDSTQRAALAWGEALECAKAGGSGYARLPAATRAAVESIGGMLALRRADDSQVAFLQRQFVAAHKAEQHREGMDALLLSAPAATGLLQ
jgi:hypothetical protein